MKNHKHSPQPIYHKNKHKIESRKEVVNIYRKITGLNSIPVDKGYWTLCCEQPDEEGSEIVQLTNMGFINKKQFFGIDYDIDKKGIIEKNKQYHPEANWFEGEWTKVIRNNYSLFNPGLVFFDYTKTIAPTVSHVCLAKTMNMCPAGTVVAANLMLSDGHSKRELPHANFLIEKLSIHLRPDVEWKNTDFYYSYKSSRTQMGIYFFWRDYV